MIGRNWLPALMSLLLLLSKGEAGWAQPGRITVVQDTSIDRVLRLYKSFAGEKRQEEGFRVQLSTDNSRQPLLQMKARFLQEYPDVDAYITYHAPQFKLRVGDFTRRADAETFRNEIIGVFPSAFVVSDLVFLEGVGW